MDGPRFWPGAGPERRAIRVPLTPVTKGLSRSLRGSPTRRSGSIAARMAQIPKLTVRTVSAESVRAVIYRKLGVSSRGDAVNCAKKLGFLDDI